MIDHIQEVVINKFGTYIREHALHGPEELVVRPEVVAPLRTAVNLVYRW